MIVRFAIICAYFGGERMDYNIPVSYKKRAKFYAKYLSLYHAAIDTTC